MMNHKFQSKLSENARKFVAGIFEELETRMIANERYRGKNGMQEERPRARMPD